MPFAQINGINMYYEIHGEGAPVVLIQGFTRNTLNWKLVLENLQKSFQVLVFDNRGSGRTDHPSQPYSIEMMSTDLSILMEHLHIPQACIVGHSMGGAIVQQFCADNPEKVKKAVICSSFCKVPYCSLMQIDTIIRMTELKVPKECIYRNVLPWLYSNQLLENPGFIEHVLNLMLHDPFPQNMDGFIGQGAALKSFNFTNQLHKIANPCLILVGENDLYAPVSSSLQLHQKITKAQMKIFPHQGHMINEEIPEQLCYEIKAFLAT
ncbi:MAG: alpha/beta hydrolase [Chlamydiae bacterium]|nr:alpha/beta hydrolase [Chlamydiota bacterium]